jgi:mono/diheme cytochrome c family protein
MTTIAPRNPIALVAALIFFVFTARAFAAQLVIDLGAPRAFESAELLARPDAATITVPADATYKRAMTYRATPLRALLGDKTPPPGAMLQFVAADGFVANLPAALVFPPDGRSAQPWLAIETPENPWPPAPGGGKTGPFYLVWLAPGASGVLQENWPYAVVKIQLADAPAARWPQIALGDDAPAMARRGQELVVGQCMVCHRLDGAGDAQIGPDLMRPHSPTEYLQPWALRALIRDPASLRNWPERKMPGFAPDVLSDEDIESIAAYLATLAARRN